MKSRKIQGIPEEFARRQPIVIYDGECSFCHNSIQFLLRHDHSGKLSFASRESCTGFRILALASLIPSEDDTLLLLQDNQLSGYSTAILEITKYLGFPWFLLRIFHLVPTGIRDGIYKFIARNRYKWFGKKPFCLTDKKEYNHRFLN
jgi:predicted DCC family thiol-disulfide oxidoreductase YuxK